MTNEPNDDTTDASAEPGPWDMLARYVAGESPVDEVAAIERWLAAAPGRVALVDALRASLDSVAYAPPADLDVEGALVGVHSRLDRADVRPIGSARNAARSEQERGRAGWSTTLLRVAATAVLLLAGMFVWRIARSTDTPALTAAATTYTTDAGRTDTIPLADGSVAVLGPASRLTVPAEYGETDRQVELDGVALFDVLHDAARAFTVRAGSAEIRDLGTTFAVRSEADDVRVVVTEGSVILRSAVATDDGVVLQAGDRGSVGSGGIAVAEPQSAQDADLAWTRGQMVFRDAPLSEVAVELRRWYGVETRFADPALARRQVSVTFEGETLDQVLSVIALTVGLRMEQNGDTVVVSAAAPR
jgi:transmembrane sensor